VNPPAPPPVELDRALAVAREAAGRDGVALATGSIYLIADLLRPEGARGRSML
jgi:dihydrofolate synthase/folylpolyglutamate synthase